MAPIFVGFSHTDVSVECHRAAAMASPAARPKETLDIFVMRYHRLDKVRDVNQKVTWDYQQDHIAKTIFHTATVRVDGFGSACVGAPSKNKRDAQDSAARKFLSCLRSTDLESLQVAKRRKPNSAGSQPL